MKYIVVLIITLCAVSVAFAQQQPEFNLKLNPTEVDTIGKALGKLPFEDVAILIQKLRQQIMDQQKPQGEPEKK